MKVGLISSTAFFLNRLSFAIFVKSLVGIRVSDDDIEVGLDISSHGQSGYKLEP